MKEKIFIKRAKEQVRLEEYLRAEFKDAKIGDIEIGYTPLGVRIIIHTVSPGLVIGPGGEKIREIVAKLKADFGLENPQIDVQKISRPDLDPNIVAQSIAAALEKNVNMKKVGNFYVERIMRAGAVGCEIVAGGKLGGEKARKERFTAGYLKKCGEPAMRDVARGIATACPKLGDIGIKVMIMHQHSDKKIIVEVPERKEEEEIKEMTAPKPAEEKAAAPEAEEQEEVVEETEAEEAAEVREEEQEETEAEAEEEAGRGHEEERSSSGAGGINDSSSQDVKGD
jgi:small subunit ribosomal protein S3